MHDSSFGRIVSVLLAPAKTFASIAARPTWLVPLLVLAVLGLAVSLILVPKVDWGASIREQLESSGAADQVSAEQLEQQVAIGEKVSGGAIYFVAVVGPWLIYPLIALFFLGLFKLLGSEMSFKQSLATLVHAFIPFALAALLTIPVLYGRAEISAEEMQQGKLLASNVGAFLADDASPALLALASSIDLFTIWAVVLLVIGYHVVARVSRTSTLVVVLGSWLAWVAIKVGIAVVTRSG